MPLTLPVRTTPGLYQPETRSAIAGVVRQTLQPRAADWFGQQWLWGEQGDWRPGSLRLCAALSRDVRRRMERILAADVTVQATIRDELGRMIALHRTPHEPVVVYFPDGIGIMRPGIMADVRDWRRRDLLASVCLICERAETPSEAIARHDDYTALVRQWGLVLRDRDKALVRLQLPKVDCLLPREQRSRRRPALRQP